MGVAGVKIHRIVAHSAKPEGRLRPPVRTAGGIYAYGNPRIVFSKFPGPKFWVYLVVVKGHVN